MSSFRDRLKPIEIDSEPSSASSDFRQRLSPVSFSDEKPQRRSLLKDIQYGAEQALGDIYDYAIAGNNLDDFRTKPAYLLQREAELGLAPASREEFLAGSTPQTSEPEDFAGQTLAAFTRGGIGALTTPDVPGTGPVGKAVGGLVGGAVSVVDKGLEALGIENPLLRIGAILGLAKTPGLVKTVSKTTPTDVKRNIVEKSFGIKPDQINRKGFQTLEDIGLDRKPLSSFVDNDFVQAFETDLVSNPKYRGKYDDIFGKFSSKIKGIWDDALLKVESQGLPGEGLPSKRYDYIENPRAASFLLEQESNRLSSLENRAWQAASSHFGPNDVVDPNTGRQLIEAVERQIENISRGGVTTEKLPKLKYLESLRDRFNLGAPALRDTITQAERELTNARRQRMPDVIIAPLEEELNNLRRQIPINEVLETKKVLNSEINWDEVTRGAEIPARGLRQEITQVIDQVGANQPDFYRDYRAANAMTSDLKSAIHGDIIDAALTKAEPERIYALLSSEKGVRAFDQAMNFNTETKELGNVFKKQKIVDIFENKIFKNGELRKGSQNFLDLDPAKKRLVQSIAGNQAYTRLEKMSDSMTRIREPLNKYLNSSGTAAALERQGFTKKAIATAALVISGNWQLALGGLASPARRYVLANLITDPKIQQAIITANRTKAPADINRAFLPVLKLVKQIESNSSDIKQ